MSPAGAWARTLLLFGAALLCTAGIFALTLWLNARYGDEISALMERGGSLLWLVPLAASVFLLSRRRRSERRASGSR